MFKNVYQVPPGHVIIANEYQYRIYRYWNFNYPLEEMQNNNLRDEEAIELFRDYFNEAVKLRLRADVPVGVYLSGGIDSCSILGTVAKFKGSGVKAFTIGFQNAHYDETSIAKEMAELTGAEFNPCLVTQEALIQNFIESIWHCETTVFNTHTIAKFILSKSVRDSGYKVVLTGEGSDEILGGYAHFRQDMLLYTESKYNLNYSLDELEKDNSFDVLLNDVIDNNAIERRVGFVPSCLRNLILGSKGIKTLFSQEFDEKFSTLDPYSIFLDEIDVQNQLRGRHILNQSQYLWSKLFLPTYLLGSLGDRMEMAHSVEGRLPFLDHKLVEFVSTLPVSYKIRNMTEKYILREAVRPIISNTVYKRRKQPFIAPSCVDTTMEQMYSFLHEYICDHLHKLPFFNRDKIREILNNKTIYSQAPGIDAFIMAIASIVALQEQFSLS